MFEYIALGIIVGLAGVGLIHLVFYMTECDKEKGVNLLISISSMLLGIAFFFDGLFNSLGVYPVNLNLSEWTSWTCASVFLLYAALRFVLYRRQVRRWNRRELEIHHGVR